MLLFYYKTGVSALKKTSQQEHHVVGTCSLLQAMATALPPVAYSLIPHRFSVLILSLSLSVHSLDDRRNRKSRRDDCVSAAAAVEEGTQVAGRCSGLAGQDPVWGLAGNVWKVLRGGVL